jgi:hypothetical protein
LGVIHYPSSPEPLSKDEMIDFVFSRIAGGEGPWGRRFCCIYLPIGAPHAEVDAATTISASPSGLLRLQQRLDAELHGTVRIVRMDEMVEAFEGTRPSPRPAVTHGRYSLMAFTDRSSKYIGLTPAHGLPR